MESIKAFIKGTIKRVGDRTCTDCGATVPIFEKDGVETSICLNCENLQLEEQARELLESRELRAIQRLIEKYQVLPYQKKTNFKNYEPVTKAQEKAKEIALAFATNKTDIVTILFQGKPGRGKTHLSHSVAEVYRYFNKTALFIDMPNLLSKLRESYSYNSQNSEEEIFRLISNVDLFILDDIGAEYVKKDGDNESWVTDVLLRVINSRQDKKTVYSTNYSSNELIKKYGKQSERIVSRLLENAKKIELDGEDYRIKGIKE